MYKRLFKLGILTFFACLLISTCSSTVYASGTSQKEIDDLKTTVTQLEERLRVLQETDNSNLSKITTVVSIVTIVTPVMVLAFAIVSFIFDRTNLKRMQDNLDKVDSFFKSAKENIVSENKQQLKKLNEKYQEAEDKRITTENAYEEIKKQTEALLIEVQAANEMAKKANEDLKNLDLITASREHLLLAFLLPIESEEKIYHYKKSLELSSNYKAANNLGIIFLEQREQRQAKYYFEQSLSMLDISKHTLEEQRTLNIDIVYANYADALEDLGELEEAINACLQALNINPKNSYALNILANIYKNKGEYQKAREFAHEAICCGPDNGYAFSTIAEIGSLEKNDALFYDNIENALIRGCPVWKYLDDPAYATYKDSEDFCAKILEFKKICSIVKASVTMEHINLL